jgi:DNA replication and repair protein RecF
MFLQNIRLKNFRNHCDSYLEFGEKANVILGDNGEGKTNLLEAISYISLTKSFYASGDAVVVLIGSEIFEIEASILTDNKISNKVHIGYNEKTGEKVYNLNKKRMEPFSSIIGKFPLVFLSPDNSSITFGGPSERRKFLDLIISQSNLPYFEVLSEYRKVVRHRNKILSDLKISKSFSFELLEAWNEQLVKLGSKLIYKRYEFINEFKDYISASYQDLVNTDEVPSIEYAPSFELDLDISLESISEKFKSQLASKTNAEMRLGTTLVGPHRDEVVFKLNGLDLRSFASQGQHKTFLVALKIGEFFYLKERCKEKPLFLLDDVFAELDEQRSKHMLKLIESLSQTFITSTNYEIFDKTLTFDGQNKKFFVRAGKVEAN